MFSVDKIIAVLCYYLQIDQTTMTKELFKFIDEII